MQNSPPHVLICYRNFSARNNSIYSHVGLGNNAMHTAKCLKRIGVLCDVVATWDAQTLEQELRARPTVTHCIIEAAFVSVDAVVRLLRTFPRVEFVCRCHSQIAFLQVEPGAIELFRRYLVLQDNELNLQVSANSERVCDFIRTGWNGKCLYLPNLYDTERPERHLARVADSHKIRVSSFGAIRLMKNHATAAAAAILLARRRGVDLEFYISVNREEQGKGVVHSLRNMFAGVHGAALVEHPWCSWGEFRQACAFMDIGFQVSMTETFNITTADAVAEGVPVVVGEAIDWCPPHWRASIDDPECIARVANNLLADPNEGGIGIRFLQKYCAASLDVWRGFLRFGGALK